MICIDNRGKLLASTTAAVVAGVALSFAVPANAQTVCTLDPAGTFNCTGEEGQEAAGSFTGDVFGMHANYGSLAMGSRDFLDVNFSEGVIEAVDRSAVFLFAGHGQLSYQSTGTTHATVDWDATTLLNGLSVVASTGTVTGSGRSVMGVWTRATAGDNHTSGGTTTVSGTWSRGIWTDAVDGHNVTNTGTVTATGEWSRGVIARALPTGTCDSNQGLDTTLNVTGDVSAAYVGVQVLTCGDGTINVEAGKTVSITGDESFALLNIAAGVAETRVDGSVTAYTAAHRAIDIRAASSNTLISGTGYVRGTFAGDIGDDNLTLNPGAVWRTAGISDFRAGADSLTNDGTIIFEGEATFSELETLANSGTLSLQNNIAGETLTLGGDYIGNAGLLFLDVTGSSADMLVVAGAVSGATSINVNAFGEILPDPILVVDSAFSSANAFELGTVTGSASAFVDFSIVQNGSDYYLHSAPSAATMQAAAVPWLLTQEWYESGRDFGRRTGSTRKGRKTPFRTWGAISDSDSLRSENVAKLQGFQLGADYLAGRHLVLGLMSGRQEGFDSEAATLARGISVRGHNVGIYGELGESSGFHASALLKKNWYNARLNDRAFMSADRNLSSTSTGLQGEAGFRWSRRSIEFDVTTGLAYVSTKVSGFSVGDLSFDYGEARNIRSLLGIRAQWSNGIAPYLDAKLIHVFRDKNALTLRRDDASDAVEFDNRKTWVRLEAGFGESGNDGMMLSGWAEIGTEGSLGLRGALRF